ncbi:specific transcription factor domain protein [Aspergillus parasiticus SU-1]|uniref:Specific transcription factor domain protein n=1 Tax=Aspergillus parasiticus (strain ATCC 56775 / NRRL 5862 / SRRC 143 / SU-1) TaxID=1403190 RepID=A0A0F0IFS7_ASPPU|nr:specific transcription factor domain protein [Aspergillus parasiticus SU-1]
MATQCDKQVPQCGQCIRARETCLGYRDEWDLVFRDQTSHTIKRSRNKSERNGASTAGIPLTPPTRGLDPSLDEIGVNYFLQEFTAGGRCPSRGYLNYIPTAYSADVGNPTLVASMAAVGLVALATHQPELVRHARTKYSEAINRVNNALASPVESVKDSTLMSVISLGVFEHVSNFESWVRHVKGAAALVVARGKSQFARRSAILMFNQVRADMSAACIQSIQPFPDDMRELQEEATKYTDPSDAFWLLGILATQCATLFASVAAKNNGLPLPRDISWLHFLERSIALQDDFQYVFDLLARQEPYTIIQESCRSGEFISYNGQYHLYKTSWAIRLWNNSRMVEIIVCEIICWLVKKILAENPAYPAEFRLKLKSRLQYATQIMSRRGEEILASVPQGLGLVSLPDADKHKQPNVSGGYMLIWNLYTLGNSPVISYQNRQWVIKQLKDISGSAGIAMAFQLAEDLVKIDQRVD